MESIYKDVIYINYKFQNLSSSITAICKLFMGTKIVLTDSVAFEYLMIYVLGIPQCIGSGVEGRSYCILDN